MADTGIAGLAIVLTLAAGIGVSYAERYALAHHLSRRGFHRPGTIALIGGVVLSLFVTGHLRDEVYVLAAAAAVLLTGWRMLRRGGRLGAVALLWVAAVPVVIALDARIVAFGMREPDVIFTALLLAVFASLLREIDARGSWGWYAGLLTAGGVTVMCLSIGHNDDALVGALITGAVFGVVGAADYGVGMLGRAGARFVGLVSGGLAIRASTGEANAAIGVAAAGCVALLVWVLFQPRRLRNPMLLALVGGGVAAAGLSAPAAIELLDIYKPLTKTVADSRALIRASKSAEFDAAAARLRPIEANFRRYASRLEQPKVKAARLVPFVGVNVRAVTVSARSAANLATSVGALLGDVNAGTIAPRNKTFERPKLLRLATQLEHIQATTKRSRRAFGGKGDLDLLAPQLRDGVGDLQAQLARVDQRVSVTVRGALLADNLLGFDRPTRFLIAIQNNAESRATGGYIANYGIVTMANGRIASREFRRTSEFDLATSPPRTLHAPPNYTRRYSKFDVDRSWVNVNLAPDFPTVAAVMVDQFEQFSVKKIDGVIAIDPVGLAGLLRLTGPITVAGWPVPITADNVARIALHDQYRQFENFPDERIDFLGRVATEVLDQLPARGLRNMLRAADITFELTSQRRLQFWGRTPSAANFFAETKVDGATPRHGGDAVFVTTQNAAANKTDFFLQRTLGYDARVRREGDGLRVESTLTVALHNGAPSTGEPRYVIGPNTDGLLAGENRQYVTVYSPLQLVDATLDGAPLTLDGAPENGMLAYAAFVNIPAGATRTLKVRLAGELPNRHDYVIDLVRQPLLAPDALHLTVRRPDKPDVNADVLLDRDIVAPFGRI